MIPMRPFQILCLLAAPLAAQADIVIHAGFAGTAPGYNTPLTRFVDLDGNGVLSPATELFALQRKYFSLARKNCFIMGMATTTEKGRLVFYGADSGDSINGECYVFRSVDLDGDGTIESGETALFADLGKPTSNYAPDSVAVVKDAGGRSVVYVTSDAPGIDGLWRCQDLNDDGDALDPGEKVRWAHAGSALTIGPVVCTLGDLNRVCTDPAGGVVAFGNSDPTALKADSFAWLGFREDPLGRPRVRVFFNPSALNKLPRNVDFAAGRIVDVDLLEPVAQARAGDMVWLTIAPGGYKGADACYFATYSKVGGKLGNKNKAGQVISGLVFRGVDLNRDGDLNDGGEVQLFYNGSGAPLPGGTVVGQVASPGYWDNVSQSTITTCNGIDGLAVVGDTVYLAYEPTAGAVAVLALRDANNNNVIDAGEARQILWMTTPLPALYSTKFGCDVRGILALPAGALADPQPAGSTPFGEGCAAAGALKPLAWSRGGAPAPGNTNLALHLSRGVALAPTVLVLGRSDTFWTGLGSLPYALDGLGLTGCRLYTDVLLLQTATLDQTGAGRVALPVPSNSTLKGSSLFGQFFLAAPGANPAGVVATGGVKLTIQ